jgi:hypothetical protein
MTKFTFYKGGQEMILGARCTQGVFEMIVQKDW